MESSVGNLILFCLVAIVIVVCSVLAVTTRRILRSAVYLLFVLLATAVIYFQMDYEFLGAVQIAVYAGGVAVLIVFAILLTHKPGDESDKLKPRRKWLGLTAAVLGVAVCGYGLFSYAAFCGVHATSVLDLDIAKIGHYLLSTDKLGYLLPFEAVSVLLLACIIGSIVIARRR